MSGTKRPTNPVVVESPTKKQKVVVCGPCIPDIFQAPYFGYKRFLEASHPHPRDQQIVFDDTVDEDGIKRHDYYVDWDNTGDFDSFNNKSVTTFVHDFFPKFDADKVIKKMREGKNWARSQYFGMTDVEIKKLWEDNRNDASTNGTRLHNWIEMFYNGELTTHPTTRDWKLFEFFADRCILKPFRTEWMVFTDSRTQLCGSIHMVYISPKMIFLDPYPEEDETKEPTAADHEPTYLRVSIYDWKRSKKIRKYNPWSCGFEPLERMHNCNYNTYTMQLNLYKYILENFYHNVTYRGVTYDRIIVDELFIVVCHPNMKRYGRHLLFNRQHQVKAMIAKREAELTGLRAQQETQAVLRTSMKQLTWRLFGEWKESSDLSTFKTIQATQKAFCEWLIETHPQDKQTLQDWKKLNPDDIFFHMVCLVFLYKRALKSSTDVFSVIPKSHCMQPHRWLRAANRISLSRNKLPVEFLQLAEATETLKQMKMKQNQE